MHLCRYFFFEVGKKKGLTQCWILSLVFFSPPSHDVPLCQSPFFSLCLLFACVFNRMCGPAPIADVRLSKEFAKGGGTGKLGRGGEETKVEGGPLFFSFFFLYTSPLLDVLGNRFSFFLRYTNHVYLTLSLSVLVPADSFSTYLQQQISSGLFYLFIYIFYG